MIAELAAVAEIAAVTAETVGEAAEAGAESNVENSAPFSDSLRPSEGGAEQPKLKDGGDSGDNKKFSESERPERSGMEQPELKNNNAETHETSSTEKVPCRNEGLEGKEHPETGVPFEKKVVDTADGKKEVIVPIFESDFDAQLPDDMLKESDNVQFKECNKQLKEAVNNDPELRSKFDDDQLEQIQNGDTPDGYTWHHDAEPGKMQLVDSEIHQKTVHTGGRNIWGGGSESR